jgi:Class III cytochrome C family
MRKGNWMLVFLAIVGLVFLAIGTLQAVDVPDTVKIYEPAFKDHKKGPVNFSHKKHSAEYKVACTECHHVYKDGKNTWKEGDPVQKCSACHDVEKKQGNADKLNLAFHKNCQTCHKELKGKEAPWKKCADCHAEKK